MTMKMCAVLTVLSLSLGGCGVFTGQTVIDASGETIKGTRKETRTRQVWTGTSGSVQGSSFQSIGGAVRLAPRLVNQTYEVDVNFDNTGERPVVTDAPKCSDPSDEDGSEDSSE